MMIVVIVVIGFLIYLAINKQTTGSGNHTISQPAQNSEPLEIAKSRLARGDITLEEFEEIKKHLLTD
jgi:putative membrane protein